MINKFGLSMIAALTTFSINSSAANVSAEALLNSTIATLNPVSEFDSSITGDVSVTAAFDFLDRGASASATQSGELTAFSKGDSLDAPDAVALSTAIWEQSITNTTGGTLGYQLNFSTGDGRIAFSSHTDPSTGDMGSTGNSGYLADIQLNGASIWQSQANITESQGILQGTVLDVTRSVYDFSSLGVDLGGTLSLNGWHLGDSFVPSSYEFTAQDYTIDLGQLLHGESLLVTYLLSSHTNFANLGLTSIGANSYASISTSAVPIPAAFPFLLSGLIGLFHVRRKQK